MKAAAWWSRLDSRILEALLGLALLLVGLFEVLFPVLGVTGPLSPVDTREVHVDGVTRLPGAPEATAEVALRGTRTAELVVADPSLGERVLLVLPGVAGALLLVVILELLLRVARTLRDGDVFDPRNARRLYVIALAVLLDATLVPLLDTITTTVLVSGTAVEPSVEISYELSALWLLVASLVAAAAGAFGHGARLRADTEGLV
ncbi:DUF2975 domain-containing protein [Actinomadura miaoliensis]|uniref:DUF2975 domain-containing protein n=1 Tax=Actinomadura miaoliensis TaxID=430685 RepID=A0ABP7X2Z2_9ACTN